MSGWAWGGIALGVLLMLMLFRRSVKMVWRLALRSGIWMGLLWMLQGAGGLLGIHLGVNLLNSLVLGILGAPGLALLLMVQWAAI